MTIMTNNHRKDILDKFYAWTSDHSDWLPTDVTDVMAEIWNLEEECEMWKDAYLKLKSKIEKFNESKKRHDSINK
jgi:hypothetical protein